MQPTSHAVSGTPPGGPPHIHPPMFVGLQAGTVSDSSSAHLPRRAQRIRGGLHEHRLLLRALQKERSQPSLAKGRVQRKRGSTAQGSPANLPNGGVMQRVPARGRQAAIPRCCCCCRCLHSRRVLHGWVGAPAPRAERRSARQRLPQAGAQGLGQARASTWQHARVVST
jgi:hypothetical protein